MQRPVRALQGQRVPYALMLPYLGGTMLLVLLPGLLTFGLAFTEYDALSAPIWRGLDNFRALAADQLFWIAARNSLLFVALAVPLRLIGALALALAFRSARRGSRFSRTAIYAPVIIPDVAYALLWLWILNPLYGPLNMLLASVGAPTPVWLGEPTSARLGLVLMTFFQLGEGFVMMLAALQTIPRSVYDAAAVDGASRWQQFRHISLPMLAPWLLLLALRDSVVSLQSTFTSTFVMTKGEPYYATLFLPSLIYQESFDRFRFGTGAAMMVALFGALAVLLAVAAMIFRRWGVVDHDT